MKGVKKAVTNEIILNAVISLGERVAAIEQTMATTMATKDHVEYIVEKAKEEILQQIRPLEQAVDKDAVTIINHERRITALER